MTSRAPAAEVSDLPSHEDVCELRDAIESLRDHVQIVWQAIDEVRDVINEALSPDSPDIWSIEPPQGLPLGRFRPFAGYDPCGDADDGDRAPVEPPPVLRTGVTATPPARQQQMWEGDDASTCIVSAASQPAVTIGKITPQEKAEPVVGQYTLDEFVAFRHAFADGQVDAVGLKKEFMRMKCGKEHFIAELVKNRSADQLRLMATQCGSYDARRNTKKENAESIYRNHLTAFTLGGTIRYQPLEETYEAAVERMVMATTDESLATQRENSRREREARAKAFSNPETYKEYSQFVGRKGTDALSDEQLATWDHFQADISRKARKQKQKDTVERFESAEIAGTELCIIEGHHTRDNVPLWIVQLSNRVERSTFNELLVKARSLGGNWSSFHKRTAGFQFRSKDSAEKFAALADGDADRSEELLARKLRKMDSASERLHAMAESLEAKADEVLAADTDKLKNTARRADMAASMRAAAYRDQADAKTLRSIATALAEGEATYLDGVWNAAQVRTLESRLRQARRERVERRLKEEGSDRRSHGWSQRYEELSAEPLGAADARYATFPKPILYKRHLDEAFAKLANTPGVKQATAKMRKLVDSRPQDQEYVEFVNDYQVALLEDFLGRAKAAGCQVWWFDHCLDNYKRLKSANIHDNHELRCALRELVPHLAMAASDDPVRRAEDELRKKAMHLPDFFPTPRPLIERMLDAADLEPTHTVLEPSAGAGHILTAIRERHPEVELRAVEQNLSLQGVLTAKGFGEIVSYGDFLEHRGEYDRCIMNPPFSHDIEHVRHAHDLLAAGGRLVSIASEHGFFASDKRSVLFRQWLDEVSATVEELPDDTFQGVDAFRQTGVKTRFVVIDKL